jgi:agarase
MKRLVAAVVVVVFFVGATPLCAAGTKPDAAPAMDLLNGREGYWRIGRDRAGAWWFVRPDGTRDFLNCVTTVQPTLEGRDSNGPHYVARDWDGHSRSGPAMDRWAEATAARVTAYGFKGLGAWCDPVFHKYDLPMTRDLNLSSWVGGNAARVFSANWEAGIEEAVRRQVTPLRENKCLVGYYLDNEIDWGDAAAGPGEYFNGLALRDPNRAEVIRVIRSIWPDLNDMNRDWGTHAGTWDELAVWINLPPAPPAKDAYSRLYDAWLGHVARRYFEVTTRLVRHHDPNHLVLGVRFRGYAPPQVVAASRGLTDAQSVNYYPNDAKLDPVLFETLHERSGGQPVIVSEYGFHALDGRSGNRNTFGFPAQVADQAARAAGYRDMTTRLARVPYVIGADWFQWMDEPPSGRLRDGEDVNFGVVDVTDRPYETLVEAVRSTTPRLNGLHARGTSDGYADVWRKAPSRDAVVNTGTGELVPQ